MRKLVLTHLFLFATTHFLLAQEPTNSYAKQSYKTLQVTLEKLKGKEPSNSIVSYELEISKAEKCIESIKKKEPTFDVTSFQSELDSYKGKVKEFVSKNQAAVSDKKLATKEANELSEEMTRIFKPLTASDFNVYNGGIKNAETTLASYQSSCSAFVSGGAQQRVLSAKKVERYRHPEELVEEMSDFDKRAEEIDLEFKKSISEENSLVQYYLAKKYQIYWETAKTILPDETVFANNYTIASNLVKKFGNVEAVKLKANENLNGRLANVKVPIAVRKDVTTEDIFKKAFLNEGWSEKVLKVNLLENDWTIVKNEATSAIIGRTQTAAIVSKNTNGACILYSFTIMQNYTGSSYQSNAHRFSHNGTPMSCENSK